MNIFRSVQTKPYGRERGKEASVSLNMVCSRLDIADTYLSQLSTLIEYALGEESRKRPLYSSENVDNNARPATYRQVEV